MKGFVLLLVFSAAGTAGVLYWRHSLQASSTPVTAAAGQPSKAGKERRQRRRRGAARIPRKQVVVAQAPSVEAPPAEGPSPGEGPAPVFAPPREERAPIAPGGSSTTEVPPADVFGPLSSPSPSPSGGWRQPIDEPEPVKLRAADLKIVWQGEDLSRTETMRLDFSKEDGGRELSQDEIDARFRTKEDAVLGCVARARPDEHTYVPGRVTVRFRIQRTGTVKGVQVEAPVILHKGGLTGCIRGVVGSLRFPASSTSQVVTFPFTLM
jgi:hypothetical protein